MGFSASKSSNYSISSLDSDSISNSSKNDSNIDTKMGFSASKSSNYSISSLDSDSISKKTIMNKLKELNEFIISLPKKNSNTNIFKNITYSNSNNENKSILLNDEEFSVETKYSNNSSLTSVKSNYTIEKVTNILNFIKQKKHINK
jgi:hypothetical protein